MRYTTLMFDVYILAGGYSSRFGSDKARALYQGKPLIIHVTKALKEVTQTCIVIADQVDKYQDLGFLTLQDKELHLGPLGGLYTALQHCHSQNEWIFICSCDVYGLQAQWVLNLWKAKTSSAQAIAYCREYWEPLFAFYHVSLLSIIEESLKQKEFALQKLLDKVNTVRVLVPQGWDSIVQINTMADLERLIIAN